MTVSIWQADGSQPVREVDFLVIGAGLAGAAAGYFAAQAGRTVVITESRSPGLGASSRNAGFMITGLDTYYHHAIERYGHARTRELWTLSKHTLNLWRRFIAAADVPFRQTGSMLLAESREEASDLEAAARAMAADGIDCIFHPGDPLGRGYHAAIEQPSDGMVQPYDLVQAVIAASGAEIVGDNEVYRIDQPTADVVIVRTRQVTFQARYVIICTNAYSGSLHPFFIDKVIPTRAQCLVTEPLPEPVLNTCGYSDYGYMYYRMTFDNRLLIGGGRKRNKALEGNTTDDRTSDPVQGVLDAYLRTRFPEVAAPVDRRWSGIMGFSADGVPLVGTLPGMPSVGFAVGFTGHGLSFGAGTAERAVDHLLTGAHPGALHVGRLPWDV
ncbi:MAG: FAD-binding oxidoreductase [Anaerolineae bacterium]|nr:FAD-binding oxidoreductase [Anaerolineae bacterium]